MEDFEEKREDINLLQTIQIIKNGIKLLQKKFLLIFIGGITGLLLYFGYFYLWKQSKYVGKVSLIMQEKSISSSTALSNIAAQLGVDLSGSSSSGSIFAGENILNILTSNYIISKALMAETVDAFGNKQTLADLYLDFSKLRKKWANDNLPIASIKYTKNENIDNFSNEQDSVIQIIAKRLIKREQLQVERPNKKATIVVVTLETKNKEFSRLFPQKLVDEATNFYITTKTSVIKSNIEKYEKKADSILILLNSKTYSEATLKYNDPNPAIKTLTVPTDIISRDKNVLFVLYGETVKHLEIARVSLLRESPIIQVIDKPGITLFNNKKFSLVFALFMTVFFAALTAGFILVKNFIKQKLKEESI